MINEEYKILNNGKRITCGIIIIDNSKSILAGHPTGKRYDSDCCYDILKGCCNKGEDDLDCALRELYEESGIEIKDKENIIDLGIKSYNKKKDIHLFLYKVKNFPKIDTLKCNSFFELNGKMLPEMNGYKIINKDKRNLFYKGLQYIFKTIEEL